MQNENLYLELEKLAKEKGLEIYKISAATKQGVKELLARVSEVLKTLPKEDLVEMGTIKVGDKNAEVVGIVDEDGSHFELKEE